MLLGSLVALGSGCASAATGMVADAISGTGGAFADDNDPEFVAAAVPFGLKTMESVLQQKPEHLGLLTSLTAGYAQYGYAFLGDEADRVEDDDYARAKELKRRALNLYKRALNYGLRGLLVIDDEITLKALQEHTDQALAKVDDEDEVGLLYWTAAAWGLYIGAAGLDPAITADFPVVQKMAERAMALKPDYGMGALPSLLATIAANSPTGSREQAEAYFKQAITMSGGKQAGIYVSYAENVAVKAQNLSLFKTLLQKAQAVDLEADPRSRLANVIAIRRARWLEKRVEDLFLDTSMASPAGTVPAAASAEPQS